MGRVLLCLLLAAVGGGAAAAHALGPTLSFSVSPTLVTIDGRSSGTIDVGNPTGQTVVVDVRLGNYAITSTGRVLVDPVEPPNRTAKAWISVSPQTLRLGPDAHGSVTVTSHPPKQAEPGDHHALVLLTTPATRGAGQVAVRTQVGVGVLVRMPGTIRRDLALGRLTVRRHGGRDVLTLRIANRGNVNELLEPGRVTLELRRNGSRVATLRAPGYDLLPGQSVARTIDYRGPLRGQVDVTVVVRPVPAAKDGPGITETPPPLHATYTLGL